MPKEIDKWCTLQVTSKWMSLIVCLQIETNFRVNYDGFNKVHGQTVLIKRLTAVLTLAPYYIPVTICWYEIELPTILLTYSIDYLKYMIINSPNVFFSLLSSSFLLLPRVIKFSLLIFTIIYKTIGPAAFSHCVFQLYQFMCSMVIYWFTLILCFISIISENIFSRFLKI